MLKLESRVIFLSETDRWSRALEGRDGVRIPRNCQLHTVVLARR